MSKLPNYVTPLPSEGPGSNADYYRFTDRTGRQCEVRVSVMGVTIRSHGDITLDKDFTEWLLALVTERTRD